MTQAVRMAQVTGVNNHIRFEAGCRARKDMHVRGGAWADSARSGHACAALSASELSMYASLSNHAGQHMLGILRGYQVPSTNGPPKVCHYSEADMALHAHNHASGVPMEHGYNAVRGIW